MALERDQFEEAALAHFVAQRAAGVQISGDNGCEPTRESLFWRDENGNYGVLMFNAAWWGWKEAAIATRKTCEVPSLDEAALETLQAEVARLIRDRDSVWTLKEHKEVLLSQMTSERDAALARLAELEAEPRLIWPKPKCLTCGCHSVDKDSNCDYCGAPFAEAAAGASPVEPSQAQPPAPSDTAITYMTGYSDGREWAQPSQALSLDLLERLSKTLTRLGYATPEGGMEHFNADLANQLYNLCRAVDSLFDREQPPAPAQAASGAPSESLSDVQRQAFIKGWDHRGMAHELKGSVETDDRMRVLMGVFYPRVDAAPSDTAITYMTGYSDGREWAGATNQAQSERAPLTDAEIEQAVKTHGVSWTGYREDKHGFYTIPILLPYHYKFARAIEAAHGIGTEK